MNDEEASADNETVMSVIMATSQITMMTLILTMNLRSHTRWSTGITRCEVIQKQALVAVLSFNGLIK